VDPGPIPLHCYYRFTFTCFIYILANYYLYHSIRLILCSQQIGEIDNLTVSWGKILGCVVCRFHVAASEKLHADKYPGAIVQSVAKLAGINFRKCGSFSYWFDNIVLTTDGKLAVVLIITLLLEFTNKPSTRRRDRRCTLARWCVQSPGLPSPPRIWRAGGGGHRTRPVPE
jgi:hypothetical protein